MAIRPYPELSHMREQSSSYFHNSARLSWPSWIWHIRN